VALQNPLSRPSRNGDFQLSGQRKGVYFWEIVAELRDSLMAFIRRNGPKTGLFLDVKLNKINILDCMAEREGFEPPIELPLCLISSQVHSTGLCHLSVLFSTTYDQWLDVRSCRCQSELAPALRSHHQMRPRKVGDQISTRHKMSISHGHLYRRVSDALAHRTQKRASHHHRPQAEWRLSCQVQLRTAAAPIPTAQKIPSKAGTPSSASAPDHK
jgi:hypothetical protein